MILASACLPTLFKNVEIYGVPYWDGGYIGKLPLYPLFRTTKSRDVLIVQINPIERNKTPKTVHAIQNRIHEILFNSPLLRELRGIKFVHRIEATEKFNP